MHYIYCPQCGAKLTDKPAGDEGLVPFCEKCEKLWFDTFPSASIILVVNELDEVALLRQSYISDRYCTLVAGYIKPGETAESTALREVEEEIGIKLLSLEGMGTFWFDKGGILMHCFIGKAKKADFTLSQEVDSAEWVPLEKVGGRLFPKSPGNAAYKLYEEYMNGKSCNG